MNVQVMPSPAYSTAYPELVGSTGDAQEPHWLTPEEMRIWRALGPIVTQLETALGHQLQRDSGLSFPEYYALAILSDQPDHRMRMSDLAFLVHSELSRLSHLMKRLETRGLVRREPDPTDGRYTLAILTDEGSALNASAAPGHVAEVRRLVFTDLNCSDLAALGDALESIATTLADNV